MVPKQVKNLITEKKGDTTTTDFVIIAIKELLEKLDLIEINEDMNTTHISISRPGKEIEDKMYRYVKEKKMFLSRGSFIRFSIMFKILNEMKTDELKELTVEEYLQKNNLRIIGKA